MDKREPSLGTMTGTALVDHNKILDFMANYSLFADSFVHCWVHSIFALSIS